VKDKNAAAEPITTESLLELDLGNLFPRYSLKDPAIDGVGTGWRKFTFLASESERRCDYGGFAENPADTTILVHTREKVQE